MKIEKQVCNIEQSVKLIQLGIVKNKSFFTWLEAAEYDEMGSNIITWHPCLFYEHKGDYECCYSPVSMEVVSNGEEFMETKGNYPAFTMPELGAMLNVTIDGVLPDKYNKKEVNAWFAINEKHYQTEVGLRAGILIYLLETGLLAVSTCNSRLLQ